MLLTITQRHLFKNWKASSHTVPDEANVELAMGAGADLGGWVRGGGGAGGGTGEGAGGAGGAGGGAGDEPKRKGK